uniref:Uncharacterized protein n=1 Tax=Anguilla anguilla TaxID=7936 RepID=A0A0E9SKJ4_ANGAN
MGFTPNALTPNTCVPPPLCQHLSLEPTWRPRCLYLEPTWRPQCLSLERTWRH